MEEKNNSSKPLTIGLIIPHLYDSYQELILRGIIQKVRETHTTVICYVGGALNLQKERHQIRNELYNMVNPDVVDIFLIITGPLITASGTEGLDALLEKIKGKPAISIGIEVPGMHNIMVDNDTGMSAMVEHLIVDHNCKKPAIITGPKMNDEAMERFEAYKKVLEKHNIPFNEDYVYYGSFSENDGIDGFKAFYDERKIDFDAIIGADDWTTSFLLEYLQRRNIKVPEDFIVTGFDDTIESQYTSPTLTTVRQPIFQLGYQAVELAHKVVTTDDAPNLTYIPTHLIKRDSCGCESYKIFADVMEKKLDTQYIPLHEINCLEDVQVPAEDRSRFAHDYKLLESSLWEITRAVLAAIKAKSIKRVLKVIKGKRKESLKQAISLSVWTGLLSSLIGALSFHTESEDEKNLLAYIWSLSLNTIYQEEICEKAHEKDNLQEWEGRIQRIGDWLTTTFDHEEVLNTLYKNLSLLNISNCTFSIFERSKKKAHLVFSMLNSKQSLPVNKYFESKQLHPDQDFFQPGKAYLALPLLTEVEQFGFVVFNIERISGKMYEDLSAKIATALKNVELMEKLNAYTTNLEKEVKKRTKQLERANKLLRMKSFKDPLSGLMNRRFLMEVILPEADLLLKAVHKEQNPADRREYNYTPCFGVYILDIDFFKKVNDTYGHHAGDMIIKQFSDILTKHSRKEDFIIRFGGEEFLIILKSFKKEYLMAKAEEVRRVVENYRFEIDTGETINKTCSMGCIVYPVDTNLPNKFSLITAINLADKGLYFAKENGRNRAIQVVLNIENENFTEKTSDDILNNFDDFVEQGMITLRDTNPDRHD